MSMKGVLSTAMVLVFALAGCTAPAGGGDVDISHVHGLAFEPDQGAVFVATHNGLAKGIVDNGSWSWSYVGSDRYDYMGFTQDAGRSGVFYSSGHPDRDGASAYGGVHLGLRRSMDAGETWQQRSLKGEVDFHALTSIPGQEGWIAGYWQKAIKVSTDGGATWTDHLAPPAHVWALAGAPDRLLAGTSAGLFEAHDLESFADWQAVDAEGLPAFVSTVAASPDGQALFASTGNNRVGSTYRSTDGGDTWTELEQTGLKGNPRPVLFAVDPDDAGHVFASTWDALVLQSHDQGATWSTIRQA